MSEAPSTTICLEIPTSASQEDIWELEDNLGKIEGITTDLQEARSLVEGALLFLTTLGTVAANVKAIYDIAKVLYDFMHTKKQRYNLLIHKNGLDIELKNLTLEEIARLLNEA